MKRVVTVEQFFDELLIFTKLANYVKEMDRGFYTTSYIENVIRMDDVKFSRVIELNKHYHMMSEFVCMGLDSETMKMYDELVEYTAMKVLEML